MRDSAPLRLNGNMPEDIRRAAQLLREGRLVAFPTETVYGLGADATSAGAVREVFRLKGRPAANPLIVHGGSVAELHRWCRHWPAEAKALAERFWPGPLTMILPAAEGLAPEVLAGGETVGLRVPAHPVALELLGQCRFPVAAPSANPSTRLSPTTADAVVELLGGGLAAVLDGGRCDVGIESAVLDLTGRTPVILRPGVITREELSAALGRHVALQGETGIGPGGPLRSPGMLPRHYSPKVPARLVAKAPENPGPEAFLVCLGDDHHVEAGRVVLPADPVEYARHLYESLLVAEGSGAQRILIERPPQRAAWLAVLDRLERACTPEQPPHRAPSDGKEPGQSPGNGLPNG